MNQINESKQAVTANTRNTVPKNVMVVSEKLTKAQLEEYHVLWQHYTDCKDEFLKRFSGHKYMVDVKACGTIRNMVRKEQQSKKGTGQDLAKHYSLQTRHWVMAVADACQSINSMWSNLANALKRSIRDNSNILPDERLYLYLIVQDRMLWKCVIDNIPFPDEGLDVKFLDARSKVEDSRVKYLHSYLRRKTRDKKPAPETHSTRCMLLDDNMYSIIVEANATYLEFMSPKPRKRYRVRL